MNFTTKYYQPNDASIMATWKYQPTKIQLQQICKSYGLIKTPKDASETELIRFLDENNVQLSFSTYTGDKELEGAIIHWMEAPKATSDSHGSECMDDCECCASDRTDSEMNEKPLDAAFTTDDGDNYPYHIDVQLEEEVEMMELLNN